MKLRNLLTLISMALLVGVTACSTSGEAEADEQAQTQQQAAEQAQTQQQIDEQAEAQQEADEQAEADAMADKKQMMKQMCPMQVEGTTRKLVKLDDSVAMDFTTTGDVQELRQRVQKMAQMHNQMSAGGGMQHGQMHGDQGQMHGHMHGQMTEEQRQMRRQMMQMMSDITVETEEIDSGMRMKLTPEDKAQVDKLYQMMEQHTQMMGEMGQQDMQGQCPMMEMMGGGPAEKQEQ